MADYNLDRVTKALRPGITVAIAAHPARFRNGMLARAMTSVLVQTVQPAAILVCNDIDQHGAGWNRRELLDQVHTEWLAWIDSDDEWMPHHLQGMQQAAEETGSVFVFPWFHGNDPLGHFGLEFNPCTPHHTTMGHMVRTDIAKRVGFYDSQPGPFSNEDWLFIVGVSEIACAEGLKMTHIRDRSWTYWQSGQNSSGKPGQGDAY